MKSSAVAAGIVSCVLGQHAAPSAQLGDVARKEAERRKTVKSSGKTYTNDTLPPAPSPSSAPASSGTQSLRHGSTAPTAVLVLVRNASAAARERGSRGAQEGRGGSGASASRVSATRSSGRRRSPTRCRATSMRSTPTSSTATIRRSATSLPPIATSRSPTWQRLKQGDRRAARQGRNHCHDPIR